MSSYERLLKALSDDLASSGHLLSEHIKTFSADDLTSFANILNHWSHQLQRELDRRASTDDR